MAQKNEKNVGKKKKRKKFNNISAKAWEHPADRAALSALEAVPGLDALLKRFVGKTTEQSFRLLFLASAVRVSENQFSRIYNLHREACRILDMPYIPELYVAQNPFLNAGAYGVDQPFVVMNTSTVEKLSDDELLAVIGHEIGHIMSGHVLYKTLLVVLLRLALYIANLPLGNIALYAIIMALLEWDRKSELSADRAAVLVVQEPMVYYNLLMKMAGGADYSQMDVNEFFVQAADYEAANSLSDSIHKWMNLLFTTHPFPVLRLTELKTWVDQGGYYKILNKEFIERGEDDSTWENVKSAGKQYKDDMKNSEDPIAGFTNTVFDTLGSFSDKAGDSAGNLKGKAEEVWDSFFGDDDKTR